MKRWRVITAMMVLGALGLPAAVQYFWQRPLRPPPQPMPALADAAQQAAPPGALTYVVELQGKGAPRQWLVSVREGPPAAGAAQEIALKLWISTGDSFDFSTQAVPLVVSTRGPWREGRKPPRPAVEAPANVPRGFLEMGLDRFAQLVIRVLPEMKDGEYMGLAISNQPFTEEQQAEGRKKAARLGLSRDDLRLVAGTIPSITAYFQLIQSTHGLSDILYDLIDKPSMLSVLLHGVQANFALESAGVAEVNGKEWGLPPGTPCHRIPLELSLNGKPAVDIDLVVADPDATGLANVAGIAGFTAVRPDKQDQVLTCRLLPGPREDDK